MNGNGYYASKISEGKWGIFYRSPLGTYGPKHIERTKKAAERKAADWNRIEAQIAAEEQS